MTARYAVRKQSSGRAFSETFYVYDNASKSRVSVHAGSRQQAQAEADDLNIGAMVRDFRDDPRPYAVRLDEARRAFEQAKAEATYRDNLVASTARDMLAA